MLVMHPLISAMMFFPSLTAQDHLFFFLGFEGFCLDWKWYRWHYPTLAPPSLLSVLDPSAFYSCFSSFSGSWSLLFNCAVTDFSRYSILVNTRSSMSLMSSKSYRSPSMLSTDWPRVPDDWRFEWTTQVLGRCHVLTCFTENFLRATSVTPEHFPER